MPASDIFVTGTDTNIGKTVLSALLCAALGRVYWKPVQTGIVEGYDRESVMRYAGIPDTQTFPETFTFQAPLSPHLAARMSGRQIQMSAFQRPPSAEPLVIEGAGGVLVPLNDTDLMIDLMRILNAPVLLATRTTLGTINHSLLSVEALRRASLQIKGVVMIGDENEENRRAIERYGNVRVVGRIPVLPAIDRVSLIAAFKKFFDPEVFQ